MSSSIDKNKTSHVVTLGNFDGVHIGHQALLKATIAYAKAEDLSSMAITFDPHPVYVLPPKQPSIQSNLQQPSTPPSRLTNIDERVRLLKSYGIQDVLVLPFTTALAATSSMDFFKDILCDRVQTKALFVGHDFALGKDRAGGIERLMALSHRMGIVMRQIEAIRKGTFAVSSTRIRASLLEGVLKAVTTMLGRYYRLSGKVTHGHGRGKGIGVPTANLVDVATLIPKRGVYATLASYKNAQGHNEIAPAVTNIGIKPTFPTYDQNIPKYALSIETHILNKNVDLYGCELAIDFVERLRDEQRFNTVDDLVAQIHRDIDAVTCLGSMSLK